MDFLHNHEWQIIFIIGSVAWFLLLFRELYRYRLLISKWGIITAYLCFPLIFLWIVSFFYMCFRIGIWISIFTYGSLFLSSSIILFFKRGTKTAHLRGLRETVLGGNTEMTAKSEWERKLLSHFISRKDVLEILSRFDRTPEFLKHLIDQLKAFGNKNVIESIGRLSNLEQVLIIYAKDEWSEIDKIIAASNYLNGNHK